VRGAVLVVPWSATVIVVVEVVRMSIWLVVAGVAAIVLVVGGSVAAALLAVATEVESETLLDTE
jgi:hypothetical protein